MNNANRLAINFQSDATYLDRSIWSFDGIYEALASSCVLSHSQRMVEHKHLHAFDLPSLKRYKNKNRQIQTFSPSNNFAQFRRYHKNSSSAFFKRATIPRKLVHYACRSCVEMTTISLRNNVDVVASPVEISIVSSLLLL